MTSLPLNPRVLVKTLKSVGLYKSSRIKKKTMQWLIDWNLSSLAYPKFLMMVGVIFYDRVQTIQINRHFIWKTFFFYFDKYKETQAYDDKWSFLKTIQTDKYSRSKITLNRCQKITHIGWEFSTQSTKWNKKSPIKAYFWLAVALNYKSYYIILSLALQHTSCLKRFTQHAQSDLGILYIAWVVCIRYPECTGRCIL